MSFLSRTSNWEHNFKRGRSAIGKDFSQSVTDWCDAIESVPENSFDDLYDKILNSIEEYIVNAGWKLTDEQYYDGIEELAVMARIYSPDTYEILPELVKRLASHLNDKDDPEYIKGLGVIAIIIAEKHFYASTYLDSYSAMCKEIVWICDTIGAIRMDGTDVFSDVYRTVFSELAAAIDAAMNDMPEEQMFKIGFEWFDSGEKPYCDYIDDLIDDMHQCVTSDSRDRFASTRKEDINGFVKSYLNYPRRGHKGPQDQPMSSFSH